MLAGAVRRGDSYIPYIIEDDFNRPNSDKLGFTSMGRMAWNALSGEWSIQNNRLHIPTAATDPVTVINALTPDVDVSIDVSNSSGDAVAFRVKDKDNFLRLGYFYNTVTTRNPPVTTTLHSWTCVAGPVTIPGRTSHTHSRNATSHSSGSSPCNAQYHNHGDAYGHKVGEVSVYNGTVEVTRRGGTSTSTTRRVYLDKIEDGEVTNIDSWSIATPRRLRVIAIGETIQLLRGEDGDVLVDEVESDFNLEETKHGVSRRSGGKRGTALDNFRLVTKPQLVD